MPSPSTPTKPAHQQDLNEHTKIVKGVDNVIEGTICFVSNSLDGIGACIDNTGASLLAQTRRLRESFENAKKRGIRINCVTEITIENISYCKQLMQFVNELRHVNGIKGNFYVSETAYIAPAKFHQLVGSASQLIYSNVVEIVEQQQFVFDSFWKIATPAKQRVREIEQGNIAAETVVVFSDYRDAVKKEFEMIKKAKKEIQVIYSTVNAFHMQEQGGVLQLLTQMSKQNENLKISILSPIDKTIQDSSFSKFSKNYDHNIRIQDIAPSIRIKIKSLVVDRKELLMMGVENQKEETATASIGFSFYSNSESMVLSYASIFEVLYSQSIHFEQLKQEDRVKSGFIYTAAHELRTPIMPIMIGIEVLEEKLGGKAREYQREIDIIARNASKLQSLAESILQVSKIENGTFSLRLQQNIDIHALIAQVIEDVERKYAYTDKADKISIVFLPLYGEWRTSDFKSNTKEAQSENKTPYRYPKQHDQKETELVKEGKVPNDGDNHGPLYADCDAQKIAQVIFNLLDNAMKFTLDGKVLVTTDRVIYRLPHATGGVSPCDFEEAVAGIENKPYGELEKSSNDGIMVTVMDTGPGIDLQNKNRLFEKFATRSTQGTGLGLYLSKKIIETHGGNMWYEDPKNRNNEDVGIFDIDNNKKIETIFKFIIPGH